MSYLISLLVSVLSALSAGLLDSVQLLDLELYRIYRLTKETENKHW